MPLLDTYISSADSVQVGYKEGAVFLRGDTNIKRWKKYGPYPPPSSWHTPGWRYFL